MDHRWVLISSDNRVAFEVLHCVSCHLQLMHFVRRVRAPPIPLCVCTDQHAHAPQTLAFWDPLGRTGLRQTALESDTRLSSVATRDRHQRASVTEGRAAAHHCTSSVVLLVKASLRVHDVTHQCRKTNAHPLIPRAPKRSRRFYVRVKLALISCLGVNRWFL